MGKIKRLGLIVFGLAGVLCLAALALPWIGPYQQEATELMDNEYYYLALQVVLAITVLGMLVTLLRGIFTPGKRKNVVIDRSGGDQISVSANAIKSQATHAIEADGRFVAEKVRVNAKKRGVKLDVRVRPRNTVNLAEEGRVLHDELAGNLTTICGDRVKRINLEFVEAENPIPAEDVTVEHVESLELPASVYEHAAQLEAGTDITVPAAVLSPQAPDVAGDVPPADETESVEEASVDSHEDVEGEVA